MQAHETRPSLARQKPDGRCKGNGVAERGAYMWGAAARSRRLWEAVSLCHRAGLYGLLRGCAWWRGCCDASWSG